MKSPLSLKITVTVTDAAGKQLIHDSFERHEMSEDNLVTMQGAMGQAFGALQAAAEAKAKQ